MGSLRCARDASHGGKSLTWRKSWILGRFSRMSVLRRLWILPCLGPDRGADRGCPCPTDQRGHRASAARASGVRAESRTWEQIVDVPVPQIQEEGLQLVPERVQNRTLEQIVDVLCPRSRRTVCSSFLSACKIVLWSRS